MSETSLARIHASVDAYYSATVEAFGATPRGVDWTCAATQNLRFVQLLRDCDKTSPASINDLGCGYGALLAFCRERWPDWRVDYLGIDLSSAMLRAARSSWPDESGVRFVHGTRCARVADYSIASGIFNVCGSVERNDWEEFIRTTLRELKPSSRRGFAVNFMAELAPGSSGPRELYRTPVGRVLRARSSRPHDLDAQLRPARVHAMGRLRGRGVALDRAGGRGAQSRSPQLALRRPPTPPGPPALRRRHAAPARW